MNKIIETKYVLPSGDGKADPIEIDMVGLAKAEVRKGEIAQINVHNAPELAAYFNQWWELTDRLHIRINKHYLLAEECHEIASADALLEADDVLKAKGVKSTAETRAAVVTINPKVRAIKQTLIELQTIREEIKGKSKGFANSFFSVHALIKNNARSGYSPTTKSTVNDPVEQEELSDFSEPSYR